MTEQSTTLSDEGLRESNRQLAAELAELQLKAEMYERDLREIKAQIIAIGHDFGMPKVTIAETLAQLKAQARMWHDAQAALDEQAYFAAPFFTDGED